MPASVIAAYANELNSAIDAQRRLIARWPLLDQLDNIGIEGTLAVEGVTGNRLRPLTTSENKPGKMPNVPQCTRIRDRRSRDIAHRVKFDLAPRTILAEPAGQ